MESSNPPPTQIPGHQHVGITASSNTSQQIIKLQEKIYPGFRLTLLISLAVYLAMFICGIRGVGKCKIEENIPLFLIATGAIGLISKIITFTRKRVAEHIPTTQIETCLYTVEMVFFVLGCYWVYKVYPPSYDEDQLNYCNKTSYLFAFIYLTTLLAIGGAIVAGFACFLCCICLLSSQKSQSQPIDVEAQQQRSDENLIIT